MATTTPNYGLTKPDLTELYDIGVQNTNMDLIDSLSASKTELAEINSGFVYDAQTSVTIPSQTSPWTNIDDFSLTEGTWLVLATINYAANATGYRCGLISTTSNASGADYRGTVIVAASPADVTRIQVMAILTPTSTTTYYIEGKQNSGSSLTAQTRVQRIKLR